jgi:hypothetical protein
LGVGEDMVGILMDPICLLHCAISATTKSGLEREAERGGARTIAEVEAGARKLRLEPVTLKVRRADDIAPAFEALRGGVWTRFTS